MGKNTEITKLKVLRRALLSEHLPNNCELIDINDFTIPQGTSICMFGGNITDRDERENGNAKIIESHIPAKLRGKINLYSFGYKSEPLTSQGFLSKEYEEEAKKLYEKSFRPLLFETPDKMKSQKGIEEVFSRLIFSAHCGGSTIVNVIINGFYNDLLKNYPDKQTENLINKIQFFAYAPNEMPNHNVNALLIAPYFDPSFYWAKCLAFAENQNIDVDYPRGIIKRISKSKTNNTLKNLFDSTFSESRAIMFKIGHTVCMIPGQMNKNERAGDHSIAMIGKKPGSNAADDFDETINIVYDTASLFINGFALNKPIDSKSLFSITSEKLKNNPPNSQNQPE